MNFDVICTKSTYDYKKDHGFHEGYVYPVRDNITYCNKYTYDEITSVQDLNNHMSANFKMAIGVMRPLEEYPMTLEQYKKVKETGKMKCKVGDKVIVNSGLKGDIRIDGIFCDSDMPKLAGNILTIAAVESHGEDHYHVRENSWVWSDGMVTLYTAFNLLEPCFVIEDAEGNFAMILNSKDGLVFWKDTGDDCQLILDYFDTNLVAKEVVNDEDDDDYNSEEFHSVEKIYGFSNVRNAECFNSDHRDVIWTRPTAVITELTLADVAKLAGVDVSQLKIKK